MKGRIVVHIVSIPVVAPIMLNNTLGIERKTMKTDGQEAESRELIERRKEEEVRIGVPGERWKAPKQEK